MLQAVSSNIPDFSSANTPRLSLPIRIRQRRIWTLLACIAALSIADLALTLTHLASPMGMAEMNPIARWLMDAGCLWVVASYKAFTVAIAMSLLHLARHTRAGELGTWFCFAVLVILCIHWLQYNAMICDLVFNAPAGFHELAFSTTSDIWSRASFR